MVRGDRAYAQQCVQEKDAETQKEAENGLDAHGIRLDLGRRTLSEYFGCNREEEEEELGRESALAASADLTKADLPKTDLPAANPPKTSFRARVKKLLSPRTWTKAGAAAVKADAEKKRAESERNTFRPRPRIIGRGYYRSTPGPHVEGF